MPQQTSPQGGQPSQGAFLDRLKQLAAALRKYEPAAELFIDRLIAILEGQPAAVQAQALAQLQVQSFSADPAAARQRCREMLDSALMTAHLALHCCACCEQDGGGAKQGQPQGQPGSTQSGAG